MTQTFFQNFDECVLPNGNTIKNGDIIKYEVAAYTGITRVVLFDGKLCMEDNFMYGKNISISHFLNNASYNTVEKLSLTELYKFCKENNWDTAKYITKYAKNN